MLFSDFAFDNSDYTSDFNGQSARPMFSASSASYKFSPPPKGYSPPQQSFSTQQFSPTYSSTTKPFVPGTNTARQNSIDKLWLPASSLMYPQQFNTQNQQYATSNRNFQYGSSPRKRVARSNSLNLDPDSIMKVHDDLPKGAILAWERLKAKNQQLKRS